MIHALRDVVKNLPDLLVLRWTQAGSRAGAARRRRASRRRVRATSSASATARPIPTRADAALMDRLVWVQPGQGEPDWASDGTYQAIRIIRNFVERWDRAPLREQERIIGREKASGAPLDGGDRGRRARLRCRSRGQDHAAWTRISGWPIRARRNRQENLILRRPFNYSNGVTKSGQLDMGLLFICYQADLEQGFIAVQRRLDGEPLEEYLKPVGGGYFFTLPGATSAENYLGRSLLEGRSSPQASG